METSPPLPKPSDTQPDSAQWLVQWMQTSLSIVQAKFNSSGELLFGNAGFVRLLREGWQPPDEELRHIASVFLQPTLPQLLQREAQANGLVFSGRLTLGWPAVSMCSVNGEIYRQGNTFHLIAEHNVQEWEHLQSRVLALNDDLANTQRALTRTNRHLEQRVIELDAALTATKLQEQELHIAAIAFETQEAIFITDADLHLMRVNTSFCQHTGLNTDESLGLHWSTFVSLRHESDFFDEVKRSLRQTGAWQGEFWCRRPEAPDCPEWLTLTAVTDGNGQHSHYVGSFLDISARKAAEAEIFNLAFYDPLTQLPNRRLLHDRLRHAIATQKRNGLPCALIFLDLDNFKTLNDTMGHDFGDALLVEVAQRLSACVREGDTVARLGGDEFVILIDNLDVQQACVQAEQVARKVAQHINQRYSLRLVREDGRSLQADHDCTASIGIAIHKDANESAEEMLRHADLAMYQAKAAERGHVRSYEPQMQLALNARAQTEADLREALRLQQFELHLQAQVNHQGHITGAEGLLRWQHPQRGLLTPGHFIALAEETGLILPIGDWVLNQACEVLSAWSRAPHLAHLTLSVNVSARQFRQANFVDRILDVIERNHAPAERLKLELTESLLLADAEDAARKMRSLRDQGVALSLDDFGTGFSSLSYLKRLPLNQLKIDQSFVRGLPNDGNDVSITRTIIDLARNLSIGVIAEGVETEAQRQFLAKLGCPNFQGYLFGRPAPLATFERLLNERHRPSGLPSRA